MTEVWAVGAAYGGEAGSWCGTGALTAAVLDGPDPAEVVGVDPPEPLRALWSGA